LAPQKIQVAVDLTDEIEGLSEEGRAILGVAAV